VEAQLSTRHQMKNWGFNRGFQFTANELLVLRTPVSCHPRCLTEIKLCMGITSGIVLNVTCQASSKSVKQF